MLSHDEKQLLLHEIFTVVWVLTAKFFVNVICLIRWRKELSNSLLATLTCKQTNDFKESNIFSRFSFNDLTYSLMPADASVFHDINTFICSAILSSTDFTSNNFLAKFELRCNEDAIMHKLIFSHMNKVNHDQRIFNCNLAGIYYTFCSNWRFNKQEHKKSRQ